MDTSNKQSGQKDEQTAYREEDRKVFELLNQMDGKLRFFKVLTSIIGALLIVLGIWGLTNSSGGDQSPEKSDMTHLNAKLDSMTKVNQSLKKQKEQLTKKVEQKEKMVDSLRQNQQASIQEKPTKEEPEDRPKQYQVKKDDNIWQIAKEFYDDGYKSDKIIEANNLDSPDLLRVDQTLKIPK